MTPEAAETLALEALGYLAADETLMTRFMAEAGAAPGDLSAAAADPAFLGFVLDFLLADEPVLMAFAESVRSAPERVMQARAALPGGMTPEWT
ncbi:MAG: DUF3572 domain-containing protein [Pseudomonadota bacterium]